MSIVLSCVLPGFGQLALGKNAIGVAFIGTFCCLAVLYWPLRLPRSYVGLQVLLLAMAALFAASAWHALRCPILSSRRGSLWWLVLVLPFALLASFVHSNWLSRAGGIRPFDVPSSGMERTIMRGDRVMVDLKQYRNAGPKRGEIVVFGKERTFFVKRVIAVAGDSIEGHDGAVFLNKQRQEEPYAIHLGNAPDQLNTFGPIVVPDGEIFVMGDNRDVSRDSRVRDFGLVTNSSIIGRALYIIRSSSRRVGTDLR
jgi:signal peptidase I